MVDFSLENFDLPLSDSKAVNNLVEVGKQVKKITGHYPINFTHCENIPFDKPCPFNIRERDFSTLIPGNYSTYRWFEDRLGYLQQYYSSTFGLTHKKGGWDCNRHVEILITGCVPYMFDISKCPKYTMVFYPKKKMETILSLSGINKPIYIPINEPWYQRYNMIQSPSINHNIFDIDKYDEIVDYLYSYSKKYLITKNLVSYIKKVSEVPCDNLLIIHGYNKDGVQTGPDYLADQITMELNSSNIKITHDTLDHWKNTIPHYQIKLKRSDSTVERMMKDQKVDLNSLIRCQYFDSIWFLKSQERNMLYPLVSNFYPDDRILYFHTCDTSGRFPQGKNSFRREID